MAKTIGCIGLGRIGAQLANNLLKAGFDVAGYDIVPKPQFVAAGGRFAGSPGEVAAEASVILLSLSSPQALQQVVSGPGGLVTRCGSDHVIADLSLFHLEEKERARDALAPRRAHYLDCQITGTPEMLSERRGVIFVSGSSHDAARCDDAFTAAVERHLYVGAFGLATRLKTANNLLVAVHTTVAAEALALAVNAGIDPEIAMEVMGNGAGSSRMFVQRAPMMARREYPGTSGTLSSFMICCDLIDKEIARTGAHYPLAEAAIKLHREALALGDADLDNACVYELVGTLRRNRLGGNAQ